MTTGKLALRVLRGGGRAGLIRLALMIVGVALGVTAVLFVAMIPGALADRATVAGSRMPRVTDDRSSAIFQFHIVKDSWRGRPLTRTLLAASTKSATPPPPPGVGSFPAAGDVWVSPALAADLQIDPDLAARIPGHIVGKISWQGLQGPGELVAYIGVTPETLGTQSSLGVGWFGLPRVTTDATNQAPSIRLELAFLIVLPALGYLLVCARLSAATRIRRYASLRLLGLRKAEILRIASIESGVAGAIGAILGVVFYALMNPIVAANGVTGFTWYPQRSVVGDGWRIFAVLLTLLLSGAIGAGGVARSLRRPLSARLDPTERQVRWWLSIPFVLGIALLIEPLVFQGNTPRHPHRLTTVSGALLLAGLILAFGGLLLALRPVLSFAATYIAESKASAALRLAARRLEFSPTPIIRLLTGLVLLILVAGTGAGVLHDLEVAAGPSVTQQLLTVNAASIPADHRDETYNLDASARWATINSIVEPPHGRKIQNTEDFLRFVGMNLVVATCAQAQELAGTTLSGCRDGHVYRISDTRPHPNMPTIAAGTAVRFHNATNGEVTITVPTSVLAVPLPGDSWISSNTILVTGHQSPIGWPAETVFHFALPNNYQSIDSFIADVARLAPSADVRIANQNLDALERYRIQRGALTFGMWTGFILGCLAFLIAMLDRAVDRRRDVVGLTVLGMPTTTMRLTQLATFLLPLALGLGLAALVGNLVGNAFLRLDGRQFGWYQGGWRLMLTPVVVGLGLAALASLIIPGRRPKAEDLRRE